jgi:hypothetical protein
VREGVGSVVPLHQLSLWSGAELQRTVAGEPNVDLDRLRAHTKLEYPLSADSREVVLLWELLEGFTAVERSLFLRFAWGRSRLPSGDSEQAWGDSFTLARLGSDEPDKVRGLAQPSPNPRPTLAQP